jgi:Transglycosylase SLT domain
VRRNPEQKKPRSQTDVRRAKPSLRTLGLEILLFCALAVFGFSVVSTLVKDRSSVIVQFAPIFQPSFVADKPHLYEAPSIRAIPAPTLSPIFMPTVQYWKEQILAWGVAYSVDPNLIATVMQIESCGNASALSGAGASGLFQVMPFHFSGTDEPLDPDTNARRGIEYLAKGLQLSGGHAGLALAGYNGGQSLISRSYEAWPFETQRYYRWGSGIYREASAGWDSSPTLAAWLAAGGQSLCDKAATALQISADAAAPGNP